MKTKGKLVVFALAVVAGLLMVPRPMLAHHGTAEYDNSRTLKLTGIVTRFSWTNPHCTLAWDVKNENGGVDHWLVELTNPESLARSGWHHDSIKAGDQVTITLHPTKSPSNTGNFQRVEFADGRPALGGRGLGGDN